MKKALLMGCVLLTAGLSVSTVFAGESTDDAGQTAGEETLAEDTGASESPLDKDKIINGLFGEDGLLKDVLPSEEKTEELVAFFQGKLEESNGKIADGLEDLYSKAENLSGVVDPEVLDSYLSGYLAPFIEGGDALDFAELEAYIAKNDELRELEKAAVIEKNKDILEPGDVQIVSQGPLYTDDLEQEEIKALTYMQQLNYSKNEDNQLTFLCSAEDLVLFTFHTEEDGSFTLTDARYAADGEDFMPSVEEFCKEVGETTDECMEMIDFNKDAYGYDLATYLDEHPEYTGIEYDGQIRTAEELRQYVSDQLTEKYADTEAADETADTADAVTEAAEDTAEAVADEASEATDIADAATEAADATEAEDATETADATEAEDAA